ncbi:MAG: hypothetical protein IKL10_10690 [Clostridia bacterium]|nr:hypothetical protein [Clostridia bacterium]
MELNEHSHIITCVDILGYKEVLKRNNKDEIDRIRTDFDYFVYNNAPIESNFPAFRCKSYTDNFLFYYKLDYNSHERKMHNIIRKLYGEKIDDVKQRIDRVLYLHIFNLALAQFELINHNYFIRGGLTIGDFDPNGTIASGNGLYEAHELEEKATYPRIILNQEVVREYISRATPIPLLFDTDDNVVFIDFLSAYMRVYLNIQYVKNISKDEIENRNLEFFKSQLQSIRDNILKNLKANSNGRVFEKYNWLAKYYDYFCYSYECFGLDSMAIEPRRDSYPFVIDLKSVLPE